MASRAIHSSTFGDHARIHQGDINIFSHELLPTADDASFDSHAEEHNARCYPDTRTDLLHQIIEWADDPARECILWLNGAAGTGKSTVSRTVAKAFEDRGVFVASFFFKRGEQGRGDARLFFTTVTSQLVSKIPAFASNVRDAVKADPALPRKAFGEQFKKLILQPLGHIDCSSNNPLKIVLVVDALDECDGNKDIRTIISLLLQAKTLSSVRIRIFITSRPELPLRLGFNDIKGQYQDISLHQISQTVIKHDINAFLRYELARIRDDNNAQASDDRQLLPDWPGEDTIRDLVEMAIPLFIFAATVCRFIQSRHSSPERQLKKFLECRTTSGIDATYLPVLDQLLVDVESSEKEGIVRDFHNVVGSIINLETPLSTRSLASLLGIPRDDIDDNLRLLHSVLSIPRSADVPVRMFHLSFRDFLVDPRTRATPFWVDERKCHERLAIRCLEILSNSCLRRDVCKLRMPGKVRIELEAGTVNACLPTYVQYAYLYWVSHLEQSKHIITDGDRIHFFLKRHFLH